MARVLVVDDEPMYCETLQEVLSELGHEVEVAVSGHDALELAGRFRPDLLIVDWMLQDDLGGLEVSESIRQSNPRLTTIIITGYPAQGLRSRVQESQVFAFLEKPFGLDEVRNAVRRATRHGTGTE